MFFVARQPVLDRSSRTIGYELLFRGSDFALTADVVDGDAATAQVLLNALTEFGLDTLVGGSLAFVNLTEHFIVRPELLDPLPTDRVVLEILETVEPTAEVQAGVAALVDAGFTVALDDVQDRSVLDPLLDLAQIVKYDVTQLDGAELDERIAADRVAGRRVAVERVETHAEHDAALVAGADYFQGFYFARPTTLTARGVAPNKLAMLRLLAQVNDPSASLADIVELVSQDVALSLKTLRFVNAGSVCLSNHIESVQHAAVLLGLDKLRSWANLALMTSQANVVPEVVRLALVRARFCEIVALSQQARVPAAYYAAGLLSLLDVLTDAPIADAVAGIPLHDDIRAALFGEDGPITDVLRQAVHAERLGAPDVTIEPDLAGVQYEAIAWANSILGAAVGTP